MENIGMTRVECVLLAITTFIFSYFILKRRSFSIFYPLLVLFLLVMSGTISEISTRRSNELIVFNTPGSSTIGIRTGKTLNLYSDTLIVGPEVKKECATLGLRLKTNRLNNEYNCIKVGGRNILISPSPEKSILQVFLPDILVITGFHPDIDKNLSAVPSPEAIIFTSGASSGFQLRQQEFITNIDSVHLVAKSGAFIKRI